MKKVLLLSFLLFGCETKNATVEQTEIRINGLGLKVYEIDSCEYIGNIYGGRSDWATHKGNCKNPEHKQ